MGDEERRVRAAIALMRALPREEADRYAGVLDAGPSAREAVRRLCASASDDDVALGLRVLRALWKEGVAPAGLCAADRNPEVIALALDSLRGAEGRARLPEALAVARHPDPRVRAHAVGVLLRLGDLRDPAVAEVLQAALDDDAESVRLAVLHDQARFSRLRLSLEKIVSLLDDPAAAIRNAALRFFAEECFVQSGNTVYRSSWLDREQRAVHDLLTRLITRDPSAAATSAVVLLTRVALVCGTKAEVRELLRPLHTTDDVELRACVLVQAVELGDEEAASLLRAELAEEAVDRAYLSYAIYQAVLETEAIRAVLRCLDPDLPPQHLSTWSGLPDRDGWSPSRRLEHLEELRAEHYAQDRDFDPRPPSVYVSRPWDG
ncbi:hypothetical protein GCM10022221_66210 [Actinocorallia aurea]